MHVYIGADHGGFQFKEVLKSWLISSQYDVTDFGAITLIPDDDYPDIAFQVAEAVAKDASSRGILICRSSGGVVIAANKVHGIRAVSAFTTESARHARQDNDANVLGLAADITPEDEAKKIVDIFLKTTFSAESRHARRLAKIAEYENTLEK